MLAFTLAVTCSLAACGADRMPPKGSDEAAVVACRSLLKNVTDLGRLASTVRDEGDGYVVNAWTNGQARGVPDYVCDVERDPDAERGVVVVEVRPSPAT